MMIFKLYKRIHWLALPLVVISFLYASSISVKSVDLTSTLDVLSVDNDYAKFDQVDNCSAYFEGTKKVASCREGEVPTPAATWLFILVLMAFVSFSNKRKL